MNKIYIFSLFLGFFVLMCGAEEVSLQERLKGLENQKIKIDQNVADAKNEIAELNKNNTALRKDFLDNKRNLQIDTFKFTDEENAEKLAEIKAEMQKLEERRNKLLEEMKALMNSDAEYKRMNEAANRQFEEIKETREALPKANMHYTEVLKDQKDIDAKISEIKKQLELEKKDPSGDRK